MNVKNLHNLTRIAVLGLCSGFFAATAAAQPQPALDLTIRVIEEGEDPSGLINQIELPPPAFFNSDSSGFELSDTVPVDQALEEAQSVVDAAEETVTDSVRESISIDGTVDDATVNVTPDPSVVTGIPQQVTNIIDDQLPLDDSLQDSLRDTTDGATDTVGDIVDNTTDTVADTTDAVSGTTTQVDDLADTTSDTVQDTVSDSTGTVDDVVDDSLDNVVDVTDDATETLDDTLQDTTGDLVDTTEDLTDSAIDSTTDATSDGLVDTTSDVVELESATTLTEDTGIVDNFTEELTNSDTILEEDLQTDSLEVDQVSTDLAESADPLVISEDIQADSIEEAAETSEQIDSTVPEFADPTGDTLEDDLLDVGDNLPGI